MGWHRFVKDLVPGMAADQTRQIEIGDEILSIDDTSVQVLYCCELQTEALLF